MVATPSQRTACASDRFLRVPHGRFQSNKAFCNCTREMLLLTEHSAFVVAHVTWCSKDCSVLPDYQASSRAAGTQHCHWQHAWQQPSVSTLTQLHSSLFPVRVIQHCGGSKNWALIGKKQHNGHSMLSLVSNGADKSTLTKTMHPDKSSIARILQGNANFIKWISWFPLFFSFWVRLTQMWNWQRKWNIHSMNWLVTQWSITKTNNKKNWNITLIWQADRTSFGLFFELQKFPNWCEMIRDVVDCCAQACCYDKMINFAHWQLSNTFGINKCMQHFSLAAQVFNRNFTWVVSGEGQTGHMKGLPTSCFMIVWRGHDTSSIFEILAQFFLKSLQFLLLENVHWFCRGGGGCSGNFCALVATGRSRNP